MASNQARKGAFVGALALGLLVLAACQAPVLGPAPSLPAAGACNSGPSCCASATAGVSYYGNLKYGHDVDQNQDLYLDARVPTGASGPLPTVIYVHGGGHVGGNKCEGATPQDYLVQHGFAVFSVDYPLATASAHTSYDVPIDVELAVQWVRANAATFSVDPNGIGLWGTSAGVDVAFTAAYQAQRNNPAARVQAVAGFSGAFDYVDEYFRDPTNVKHVGNSGSYYVGCVDVTDQGCVARSLDASPLAFASHDDPPSFVATSTDFQTGCESVEPQNSVQLTDALTARGVPVTMVTTGHCGHALANWKSKVDPPATGTVVDNMITFFQQNLGTDHQAPTPPTPLPPRRTTGSLVTAQTTCAPRGAPELTYTPNVVYGQDFGHPVTADVYRPVEPGTHPAVVLVHGGGFTSGDKCDVDVAEAARMLAQNGFVAFSVNYPLATAAQPTFPNPVYDLLDGATALKAKAGQFGVDPSRIAIWGAGAGGNLAQEAALDAPRIAPGAAVPAVVAYSAPTDFFAVNGEYEVAGGTAPTDDFARYIGCGDPVRLTWDPTANACFGLYEQASPALNIDSAASGLAMLTVNSQAFTGTGSCEVNPPRQALELQMTAGLVGLPRASIAYATDCASGFGLTSQFPATLSFLQSRL